MISIWFFVGCLLSIYGVLILVEGLSDQHSQEVREVAMQNLHLQIWWGMGLLVLGAVYLIRYCPRKV